MGDKHKAVEGRIGVACGPWTSMVLVCRKCSRKLDGGFGPEGDESLPTALKQMLRDRGQRRQVRVVQVGCLDICPRGGVVAIRGDRPGEMLIVPRRLEAGLLARRLLDPSLTEADGPGS